MSQSIQAQIEQLQQAIAAQENLRTTLGDEVVDATIQVLQERLASLEKQSIQSKQQRKLATVLMADVSGFTAMSEKMDAEEVTDVMNALWSGLDAEIINHGGIIDKHMGDAVMALWGAYESHEDDVENAIRAALGMQKALSEFRTRFQSQLAMRIGINTGSVLLGEIGSNAEFTAMGDTVNLASRLEHAAPVGGILISHNSYRHVRGIFDVTPQAPLTVKGKTAPIQTYVVLRTKPRAFRMSTRGVAGIETRMIGRDAELATLQHAYEQATSQSVTTMLTIVGEAGIGKSRLLYEFDNWIELRPEGIFFFKGRATPNSQHNPHSLVRDIFRERFYILDSDKPSEVVHKFRAGMADILTPDEADIVGHFMGFDFSASPAVQNLLGGTSFAMLATVYLTTYFQNLAEEPIIIFLEDLHWADDSSLDYIIHLVGEIKTGKLLVVGLTRPEFFERHSIWATQFSNYQQIDLQLLSTQDSQTLVNNVLQKVANIPTELQDLIVNSAEGNPFYVEELIKMFVDDGIIRQDADQWHIEMERISNIYVPPTLTEVVQARLDSLPDIEKEILKRASVIGRLFWDEVLAELMTMNEEIETNLNRLNERELIFRRDISTFTDTDEYIFKHAILRDVTYESVLLKLRRTYHEQIAHWLVNHTGERINEYLAVIAEHYEFAGANEKAVEYLLPAGIALTNVSEFQSAVRIFERAMALTAPSVLPTRALILKHLGSCYERLGNYQTAQECLLNGLEMARQAGDQEIETDIMHSLGWLMIRLGEHDKAETYLAEATKLAHELKNEVLLANIMMHKGILAESLGNYALASQDYETSLDLARKTNDKQLIARILGNMGGAYYCEGKFVEAQKIWQDGAEIAEEIGDQYIAAAILTNIGAIAERFEQYTEAQAHYQKSLAICHKIGDKSGVVACDLNLGALAIRFEDYATAEQHITASLRVSREIGDVMFIMVGLSSLGTIMLGQNQTALAHQYYLQSLQEATKIELTPLVIDAVGYLAKWYVHTQEYRVAAELIGLIENHEATQETARIELIAPTLSQLQEVMSAEDLQAALERGSLFDLYATAQQLLAEANFE